MADPGSADEGRRHSTPGWVKVFGIVAAAVIVLIIVVALVSGGEHGPGRHMPGDEGGGAHSPRMQHSP